MDITHLVVSGCSFTYCQGLANPKEQGWPAPVAKAFGVEVVNLAVPGTGNDAIARRTYEYIYESLPTNSKPLVIVAWSQYWRRETWYKQLHGKPLDNYWIVSFPENKPQHLAEELLLENWNEVDFYRKTILYKLMLDNLFKAYKIPHLTSNYAGSPCTNDDCEASLEKVRSMFPSMYQTAEKGDFTLTPFYTVTHDCPKLPCGHDGPEAQAQLANYIIGEINDRFGGVNKVDGKIITLLEHRKKCENYILDKFPHWL